MTKETYTSEEILKALRSEFLKMNAKLDQLMNYTVMQSRPADEYKYNIWSLNTEDPKLVMQRTRELKGIKRKVELLKRYFGWAQVTQAVIAKDENGEYFAKRRPKMTKGDFYFHVNEENREEFNQIVEELLSDESARYIYDIQRTFGVPAEGLDNMSGEDVKMLGRVLRQASISRIANSAEVRTDKAILSYFGREDELQLASVRKNVDEAFEPITRDYFEYLKTIQFPADDFSDYHRSLIDASLEDKREIVLPEPYKPAVYGIFKFEDTPSEIVLRKTFKNN